MKIRTLGQERSEFALTKVLQNKDTTALKSFSAGAPSMILQNGFGHALAFWAAKDKKDKKDKNEHKALLSMVMEWLEKKEFIQSNGKKEDFFKTLSTVSQQEYFAAQQEALHLLEWVKRYANAFIQDNEKR